jgi:ubiquinone/menaquinone biosynthesis C-methylase UbiE
MPERSTDTAVQVRQLFDAKAVGWSSKYSPDGRLAGRLTHLRDAVVSHVPVGARVLDLGCGTGELAMAAAAAGLRVTACDISPEMMRRAAASDHSGTVDWVKLAPGWRSLPFKPSAFDAIVAASVLEYVDEPCLTLRDCSRVLRPGGVMLFTIPDVTHPIRWLEWALGTGTRVPPVRVIGRRSSKLDGYLTYLSISRQRHSVRWWSYAAARTGLFTSTQPADTAGWSPLRLLVFQRIDLTRE